MRRTQALLIAAGLVAAPVGAAASPDVEVFEWSMGKGRLGMTVMSLTPELRTHFGSTSTSGMLVGSVAPDSPAAKAGVRVGDVLVEANDQLVDDIGDIRNAMAKTKKGEAVSLDVIRDKKPLTLNATLVDDPPPPMPRMPRADAFWNSDWMRDFMESFKDLRSREETKDKKSTKT